MKFIAIIEVENGREGRIIFDAESHDAAMETVKDLLEQDFVRCENAFISTRHICSVDVSRCNVINWEEWPWND